MPWSQEKDGEKALMQASIAVFLDPERAAGEIYTVFLPIYHKTGRCTTPVCTLYSKREPTLKALLQGMDLFRQNSRPP